ncbi:hypothetical protein AB0H73_09870 [Streptomyces olivoreticuli]
MDGYVLYALRRRSIDEDSLAVTQQEQPGMVLYALAADGRDPRIALAAAQAMADARGWTVHERIVDRDSSVPPQDRPGWGRIRTAITSGQVRGVIALTRHHVTADDQLYTNELRWLYVRRAVLHLVHPETHT